MSELDEKLTEIQEILQMYPNVSVRVKFHGSDNYRHFPSDHVTRDSTGTLFATKCPADDLATAEPQTRTPLGVRLDAGDAPTCDWADLGGKDFELALQTITTVEELSGVANRRRLLNHDFKKWSEVKKSLILSRKFILENEK